MNLASTTSLDELSDSTTLAEAHKNVTGPYKNGWNCRAHRGVGGYGLGNVTECVLVLTNGDQSRGLSYRLQLTALVPSETSQPAQPRSHDRIGSQLLNLSCR